MVAGMPSLCAIFPFEKIFGSACSDYGDNIIYYRLYKNNYRNNSFRICFKRVASTAVATKTSKDIRELLKKDLPKPYDGPERDLVNFPRRVRPVEPGVVRHAFIPEEWFQFFYKKTGVTGPYLFGGGLLTFLLSKEIWVIEEEFSTGVALFLLFYLFNKKYGAKVKAYVDKLVEERKDKHYGMRAASMQNLENGIADEKKSQWQMAGQKILMEAKRENVHMQLEAEYRKRAMNVYEQVKRRLDYQMELVITKRRFEQKHMVDWVVSNVLKSISPQQEKETLQKCIQDLKMLAANA